MQAHTWLGVTPNPVVRLALGMPEISVLLCSRVRSALETLPTVTTSAPGGSEAWDSGRCNVT